MRLQKQHCDPKRERQDDERERDEARRATGGSWRLTKHLCSALALCSRQCRALVRLMASTASAAPMTAQWRLGAEPATIRQGRSFATPLLMPIFIGFSRGLTQADVGCRQADFRSCVPSWPRKRGNDGDRSLNGIPWCRTHRADWRPAMAASSGSGDCGKNAELSRRQTPWITLSWFENEKTRRSGLHCCDGVTGSDAVTVDPNVDWRPNHRQRTGGALNAAIAPAASRCSP
jgi:hypothetical protein